MAAYLVDHPPARAQYRRPRRQSVSGVIVLHTAENTPDTVATDGGAEAVAAFIARRSDPGSYHWLADSDSHLLVVPLEWEAFHDGTGTNPHSVGISAATRADWWPHAPRAWRDGCVANMAGAARDAAAWIHHSTGTVVPARRITAAQARNREPGFVTHAELDPGRRTDPGRAFPFDQFFAAYQEHDDMPLADADVNKIVAAQTPYVKAVVLEVLTETGLIGVPKALGMDRRLDRETLVQVLIDNGMTEPQARDVAGRIEAGT